MSGDDTGQRMIERYFRKRGYRIYRADDGECLAIVASAAGVFRVYMRMSTATPDVVKLRARTAVDFPVAERGRLLELVNRWNDGNQWLSASIRAGQAASRLRIVGNSRLSITGDGDFAVFARMADLAIASAAKLFEELDTEMKLPSAEQLEKWFEWKG
jgi:hypothetical protein